MILRVTGYLPVQARGALDGEHLALWCAPPGLATALPAGQSNLQMAQYLSEWHDFRPLGSRTYPKVNAAVQVRYADGKCKEGTAVSFSLR